jgi:hypothetical protein
MDTSADDDVDPDGGRGMEWMEKLQDVCLC